MGYYEEKKEELTELLELVRKEKADFENIAKHGTDWLELQISEFERHKKEAEKKIAQDKEANIRSVELERDKLRNEISEFERCKEEAEDKIVEDKKAITQLAEEKSQGFPWLAKAFADYFYLKDLEKAVYLEDKSHPALKAAEQVREVASQRRVAEKLYRVLKYQLEYYENLFPWLVDFKGEDIDDLIIQIMGKRQRGREEIEEPEDKVVVLTTEGERETLSRQELFQRALDRWWQKPKSKWGIGRDYERYIGYLYESKGYSVYYQGIVEGLADLGRDLICVKDNSAEVVQCKRWSKEKQIHEKHIFQLYGTVVAYKIDHPGKQVFACFVTSTTLSDRARQFANELRIKILEGHPLEHYPCIKCNVSQRDGTKIYHLPFDQQYDRTLIEEERNECYVETVKEAEALGFRRAFRWRGEKAEQTVSI